MDDSMSDIEILDDKQGFSALGRRGPGHNPGGGNDEEELLDLDVDETPLFPTAAKSNELSKGSSVIMKRNGKKLSNSKSTSGAGKYFGNGSGSIDDAEDDLESLPSISPPPQTNSQTESESVYDNGSEFDCGSVHWKGGNGKGQSSSKTNGRTSRKKTTYEDPAVQEVDDFFQSINYACLADFLADVDNRQHSQPSTTCSTTSTTISSNSGFSSGPGTQKSESSSISPLKVRQPKSSNSSFEVKAFEEGNKKKIPADKGVSKKKKEVNPKKITSDKHSSNSNIPQKIKSGVTGVMIVLHIPEAILSDELAAKLIEKEVRFQIVDNPALENSILFEHQIPYKMVGKDFQVHEKVVKEMDENIFIIFPVENNLNLLQNEIHLDDEGLASSGSTSSDSLTNWVKNIQRKHAGKKFTLLIQGFESYLRKVQRATQKEYRDRILQTEQPENGTKKKKTNSKQKNSIKLSRNEIQNALIGLQLSTKINYRFYENLSDLTTLLYHYGKAIAENIQQKEKEKANPTNFDWYAVADCSGGIPVEDNGKGLRSLWVEQLCQFPGVGQERALAISKKYPSPKALYEAYQRCQSVQEGKKLLADLQITVGVGVFAKKQKLGPEASKKIYRFFTASDGERELH